MKHAIVIFGYSEASMFIRSAASPRVAALLSIHGAREYGVELDVPIRLDLTFDDVEIAEPGDVDAMSRAMGRRRCGELNGRIEVAPTREDVAAILRFAEQTRTLDDGVILFHCGAGISRAPATAVICMAVWLGAGREAEAVAHVRAIRKGAQPHPDLIRLADDMLGREGRLVAALIAERCGS